MKNKVNHGPYESQAWIDDIDVANTPLVAEVGAHWTVIAWF
jgi:hypothetical protein